MLETDIDKLIPKIDAFLDYVTKDLDPLFLAWLKKYAEMHIAMFAGAAVEDLKVALVLDSNFALEAIRYYSKGKMPMLLKMAKNPMFPIYAPPELIQEVEEKIELFAKDGLDKVRMQEAWQMLRSVIKIRPATDATAKKKAMQLIGAKDLDDVAFVQVSIETRAVGILTSDNHYESPEIRKFTLTRFKYIVATYNRGVFSFFIVHNILPKFLKLFGKIILAVIRSIFKFFAMIARIALRLLAGGIRSAARYLSGLSPNAKVALGLIVGCALLANLFFNKLRDKIISGAKELWEMIKPILQKMWNWFKHAVDLVMRLEKSSEPYAFVAVAVAAKFYQNVIDMTEEIKKISAAAA